MAASNVDDYETRYRLLVENSNDLMMICGRDGVCRYISPACRTMMGCEPGEFLGRSGYEIVHPDDLDLVRRNHRRVLETSEAQTFRCRVRHRAGTYVWTETSARLVPSASEESDNEIIAVCRDVSNQVQAEEELRRALDYSKQLIGTAMEAERKLRLSDQILQRVPALVIVSDSDGKIAYIAPSVKQLLGYEPDELLGDGWWNLLYSRTEERQQGRDLITRMARGEIPVAEIPDERSLSHRNGETRWILCHDAIGPGGMVIRVGQDITERKNLEQQLRQAQKMEAVGRLAGGIAHDFNNMLTAINGYSELILKNLGEAHPMRRDIEEIRKAGDRAAHLTRQLLAFSRKQVLMPRVFGLNEVLADIDELIRRLFREDIELVTFLQPGLGLVRADAGQIEQVIMNLVINARDAMPHGGKLVILTADVDVDQADASKHPGMRPGAFVLLALSDTGCGMDADTLAHIFEPFFTTKGIGKGTGLGLSTAYGIIKQSGGYIYAASEPGKGATFEVYLPEVENAVGGEAAAMQ
jgi:two-component system cell cycle sensor histidine kinase/response regulator CckA